MRYRTEHAGTPKTVSYTTEPGASCAQRAHTCMHHLKTTWLMASYNQGKGPSLLTIAACTGICSQGLGRRVLSYSP